MDGIEQGCSLSELNYRNLLEERMKYLILCILLTARFESVNAHTNSPSKEQFCEWLDNVVITATNNQRKEIEDFKLIGKYSEQNSNSSEQSVVIQLINRVYAIEKALNPDEVAYAERASCEIAGL